MIQMTSYLSTLNQQYKIACKKNKKIPSACNSIKAIFVKQKLASYGCARHLLQRSEYTNFILSNCSKRTNRNGNRGRESPIKNLLHTSICVIYFSMFFLKKMAHAWTLFSLFSVFSVFSNKQYNFTTNQCEQLSTQYTAP